MQKAPLQLYASALVFSPRKSQIREENLAYCPTLFKYGPTVEDHWGPTLQTLEAGDSVHLLSFSYDGKYLASAGWYSTTISIWDTVAGTLHSKLDGHRKNLRSITFSRNGQLASISEYHEIRIWDPVTGATCHKLNACVDMSCDTCFEMAVAFVTDGTLAFCCGERVWIRNSENSVHSVPFQSNVLGLPGLRGLAFLSNGSLALAMCSDTGSMTDRPEGEILLYDLESKLQRRIACAKFQCASFSSNDQLALVRKDTWGFVVYNLATGSCLRYANDISIKHLSFSGDRDVIAAERGGSIYRFNLQSRSKELIGTSPDTSCKMTASPDSNLAIADPLSEVIWLWDVATMSGLPDKDVAITSASTGLNALRDSSTRGSLSSHKEFIAAMVFSSDGRWLATVSSSGMIHIWDTTTRKEIRVLQGKLFLTVTFSTAGKYLAAVDILDITLWDLASERLLKSFEHESSEIDTLTFSPNDEILVSADKHGFMKFWSSKTWILQHTLRLNDYIDSIAFSQNGRHIACLCRGYKIQIWDAEKYIRLQSFATNLKNSNNMHDISISFSADESYIDTDIGCIQLGPSLNPLPGGVHTPYKRWQVDHEWLVHDGQRTLWLPPDFRPKRIARHDDMLVICHRSNKVCLFVGNTHGSTSEQVYETTTPETGNVSFFENDTHDSTSEQAYKASTSMDRDKFRRRAHDDSVVESRAKRNRKRDTT